MYRDIGILESPNNENIKVWRYMNLSKFLSLIDKESLFLCRADKMGDLFEASLTKKSIDVREDLFTTLQRDHTFPAELLKKEHEVSSFLRRNCVINCWHMNNYESAAMWKLYSYENGGIAIQTTYKRLKESIIDERDVYLGLVQYIDYDTQYIPVDNFIKPFFYKRKSFEHENEVRLFSHLINLEGELNLEDNIGESGIYIKIDLQTLIEKIYISPESPFWFADLVMSTVKKFGWHFEVNQSKLCDNPLF